MTVLFKYLKYIFLEDQDLFSYSFRGFHWLPVIKIQY